MSLRDLAKLVNVSFSYISKLEKGQYNPSRKVVTSLANALNAPKDELLKAAGYLLDPEANNDRDSASAAAERIKQATQDDEELLEFWQELSKREDLKLLFKQVRPLDSDSIRRIIRVIKAIEDEEQRNQ